MREKKLYTKKRRYFPEPHQTALEGVVAVGELLEPDVLLEAYSFGIFPWPHEGYPLLWFCPEERGILNFTDLHVSKSLKKFLKREPFQFTYNRAFSRVIKECARAKRPGQEGTWINPPMIKAYERFHQAGYAHSVECWQGKKLVGGLYGVYVAGVFSGESMFFKTTNASKAALLHLCQVLRNEGKTWLDIQMVTPHAVRLGAKTISRRTFLRRLETEKKRAANIRFSDYSELPLDLNKL